MATRGTNAWRVYEWGDPCNVQPIAVAIYEGGPKAQIHPAIKDAYLALGAACVRHGYIVRRLGCYNCRAITGGTSYSSHAWAISVDINDDTNPYRLDRLVTDLPRALVDEITSIRTVDGVQVWRWGGDWDGNPSTPHSNYDSMHFEIVATPAELARGLAGVTAIPAAGPTRAPVTHWPVLRHGDDGDAVRFLQSLLQLDATTGLGHFGPRTEARVKQYQASRGLVADGIVGLATWTALLSNQPPLTPGAPTPQKTPAKLNPFTP